MMLRNGLLFLTVAALGYGWAHVPALVEAVYGYQSQPWLVELLRSWLGSAAP